jgi:hypothetical protein
MKEVTMKKLLLSLLCIVSGQLMASGGESQLHHCMVTFDDQAVIDWQTINQINQNLGLQVENRTCNSIVLSYYSDGTQEHLDSRDIAIERAYKSLSFVKKVFGLAPTIVNYYKTLPYNS